MRLLILCAMAMISVPGLGSAQSVLERVIGQIDGATNLAQVNGTFANIAENVSDFRPGETVVSDVPFDQLTDPTTRMFQVFGDRVSSGVRFGTPITLSQLGTTRSITDLADEFVISPDGTVSVIDRNGQPDTYYIIPEGTGSCVNNCGASDGYVLNDDGSSVYPFDGTERLYNGVNPGDYYFSRPALAESVAGWSIFTTELLVPGYYISHTIDGSIANIVTGVTSATQEAVAGAATATEFTLPTLDLGNMATTALGAVNTGEITLGVNSAVDEASTSTSRAISAVMTQIGGSADTGALVLNVASNASQVIGSIENTLVAVNGSVGNLSTTALGAVNTGTITSGVNAAVQGIVGMSGQ